MRLAHLDFFESKEEEESRGFGEPELLLREGKRAARRKKVGAEKIESSTMLSALDESRSLCFFQTS